MRKHGGFELLDAAFSLCMDESHYKKKNRRLHNAMLDHPSEPPLRYPSGTPTYMYMMLGPGTSRPGLLPL